MASSAHAEHLYQITIKLFGSEPEPPFEDERRLLADWGRKWGVDNDVGKIRSILMHRPGPELGMVDPAKKLAETGTFGDLEEGWYWQSDEIPPADDMRTQHDGLVAVLRAEGTGFFQLLRWIHHAQFGAGAVHQDGADLAHIIVDAPFAAPVRQQPAFVLERRFRLRAEKLDGGLVQVFGVGG